MLYSFVQATKKPDRFSGEEFDDLDCTTACSTPVNPSPPLNQQYTVASVKVQAFASRYLVQNACPGKTSPVVWLVLLNAHHRPYRASGQQPFSR